MNALDGPAIRRPDPTAWQRPDMLEALTTRDITTIYRLLQKTGISQQHIAVATGQSQPEVSAIIHGRKVMAYPVLHRILTGLNAPLCLAGLATCRHTPCTH